MSSKNTAAALYKAKDKIFDRLEKAKPDDPIFRSIPADDYIEAKRLIRAYFKEILEVTQPGV